MFQYLETIIHIIHPAYDESHTYAGSRLLFIHEYINDGP